MDNSGIVMCMQKKYLVFLLAVVLVALGVLLATNWQKFMKKDTTESPRSQSTATSAQLRQKLLMNTTIPIPDSPHIVTVTGENQQWGDYQNKVDEHGIVAIGEHVVEIGENWVVTSYNINRGAEDSEVFIGAFAYQMDTWNLTDTYPIGVNAFVESISQSDETVTVVFYTHAPGQAAAEPPTERQEKRFIVANNRFLEMP
jgi:hypothetical protein